MYDNLTKSDIQKMEEEIEHRKLVVRKETIQAVKEARAFGDLSENFEYYAAKQAKNQNESRIRYLENMIKTANIIEDNSADDEVGINKRVEILFEDDNETEEYKIVTSVRGDSLEGRITPESPLGAALMGHRAGERVEVKVNAKDHASSYFIKILNVRNTGEEAADVLRSF